MALEDDPLDDGGWAPGDPPHPSERAWRHPAELGPVTHGAPLAGRLGGHHRSSTLNGILTGVCLVGAALTIATVLLTRTTTVVERAEGTTTTESTRRTATSAAGPVAFVGASKPSVGLRVGDIDPQVADRLHILGGAWVTAVEPGGAAEAAGLRPDDVVLGVDGYPVTTAADLVERLDQAATKDHPVAVGVLRDGERITLRLRLP